MNLVTLPGFISLISTEANIDAKTKSCVAFCIMRRRNHHCGRRDISLGAPINYTFFEVKR
jgi:hypothetical protein